MINKSDIPDLPGKKLILFSTGVTYEIISARFMKWVGLVAVLRDGDGFERQLAIHTARWDGSQQAYILGEP